MQYIYRHYRFNKPISTRTLDLIAPYDRQEVARELSPEVMRMLDRNDRLLHRFHKI